MATNILSLPANLHDKIATFLVARDVISLSMTCRRLRRVLGPENKFLWFSKLCLPRLSASQQGDHWFTPFNTSRNWYGESARIIYSSGQRKRCSQCLAMDKQLMPNATCHEDFYEYYDSFRRSNAGIKDLPNLAQSVKHSVDERNHHKNVNRIVISKVEARAIIERNVGPYEIASVESERFAFRFKRGMKDYIDAGYHAITILAVVYEASYKRFHIIVPVERFRQFLEELLISETTRPFNAQANNEQPDGLGAGLFEICKDLYGKTENVEGVLKENQLIGLKVAICLQALFGGNDNQPTPLAGIPLKSYLKRWMGEWFEGSTWGEYFKTHEYRTVECTMCPRDIPVRERTYEEKKPQEDFPGRWIVAHFFEHHPHLLFANKMQDG
ncbi:hypothetical protein TWF281_001373 [Arthrobotrys megalospora]